jgi:hypothetical protein
MKQLTGFTDFDQEQLWKHTAKKRQSKGIKHIQLSETQEWMFFTDLDEEIDLLTCKLEAISCH